MSRLCLDFAVASSLWLDWVALSLRLGRLSHRLNATPREVVGGMRVFPPSHPGGNQLAVGSSLWLDWIVSKLWLDWLSHRLNATPIKAIAWEGGILSAGHKKR